MTQPLPTNYSILRRKRHWACLSPRVSADVTISLLTLPKTLHTKKVMTIASRIPHLDYGAISKRAQSTTKAAALHPYVRLFVFLTTFITLFASVIIKDSSLPTLTSPPNGPSGDRAWSDLQFITQLPHPWNSRQNDIVRDYILSEMRKG